MSKLKTWCKRHIPSRQQLEQSRLLKPFAPMLEKSPDYWFFNQSSVSKGCGVAALGCFMPIPFQMIIAILLSLPLRANLIIAIALLWVNNPFTMVPIYWFCYVVGASLLHEKLQDMDMHLSWHWMTHEFMMIWKPFLLGCLSCGLVAGIMTYVIVYVSWKYIARAYSHPLS